MEAKQSITVNGKTITFEGYDHPVMVNYSLIVSLAGFSVDYLATVTYKKGERCGSLTLGEYLDDVDGMSFCVVDTGRA